jgi:hypothetical protein
VLTVTVSGALAAPRLSVTTSRTMKSPTASGVKEAKLVLAFNSVAALPAGFDTKLQAYVRGVWLSGSVLVEPSNDAG